jgi:hypothetical protein
MKCALGLIISAALSLSSVALSANATSVSDLESELTELLDTVTGRYSGEVPDPTDVSGERKMLLHHKIVRVDLPRFGEYVLYHQISRDALDSAQPWQQKLYVFDQSASRRQNVMRSFVIPSELGLANFEADPVRFQKLATAASPEEAGLQGFPEGCKIRWTREEDAVFVARVRRQDCRYDSATFRRRISAGMTYRVTSQSFGLEEVFFGANGAPLFPSRGLLTVARKPSTVAAVLAASRPEEWRRLDPERTIYMDLESGRVVFELSPTFAPQHVENIRALARSGWFEGLSINRVQDNFVTQWGDPDGRSSAPQCDYHLSSSGAGHLISISMRCPTAMYSLQRLASSRGSGRLAIEKPAEYGSRIVTARSESDVIPPRIPEAEPSCMWSSGMRPVNSTATSRWWGEPLAGWSYWPRCRAAPKRWVFTKPPQRERRSDAFV